MQTEIQHENQYAVGSRDNRTFSGWGCRRMPLQRDRLCRKAAALIQRQCSGKTKRMHWDSRKIPLTCIIQWGGKKGMPVRSVKSISFFQLVPKTWGGPTIILIVKFKRIKYIHKILKECLSEIYFKFIRISQLHQRNFYFLSSWLSWKIK